VEEQKPAPLNRLLRELPPGLLADTRWLQAHGQTRSLIHDHVRKGYLERLSARLYRRTSSETADRVRWEVAVISAQQLNGAAVHVGGPTALAMLGKAHYLRLGGEHRVYLYDADHTAPTWLRSLEVSADFVIRTKSMFVDASLGVDWRRIDLGTGRLGAERVDPKVVEPWDHFLRISGEERAIIELMDEIPETVGFEHADEIFQSLTNLRPSVLTRLLQACTSIKAKRLFLFYADRHDHSWRRRVAADAVDLGKGKRQLARGGRLDPTYQITVPAELLARNPDAA
jgi:hypothetical protein